MVVRINIVYFVSIRVTRSSTLNKLDKNRDLNIFTVTEKGIFMKPPGTSSQWCKVSHATSILMKPNRANKREATQHPKKINVNFFCHPTPLREKLAQSKMQVMNKLTPSEVNDGSDKNSVEVKKLRMNPIYNPLPKNKKSPTDAGKSFFQE